MWRTNKKWKWVRAQELAIQQLGVLAGRSIEAGKEEQAIATLGLQAQMQNELMRVLGLIKRQVAAATGTDKPAVAEEPAAEAVLGPALAARDLSKMSNAEIARLAGAAPSKRPPWRPKGHPASGAAKISKEKGEQRRAQQEREAQAEPMPEGWED